MEPGKRVHQYRYPSERPSAFGHYQAPPPREHGSHRGRSPANSAERDVRQSSRGGPPVSRGGSTSRHARRAAADQGDRGRPMERIPPEGRHRSRESAAPPSTRHRASDRAPSGGQHHSREPAVQPEGQDRAEREQPANQVQITVSQGLIPKDPHSPRSVEDEVPAWRRVGTRGGKPYRWGKQRFV